MSCIVKFFDSFRLYNFLLVCRSSPISTQAKPKGVGRGAKTTMLIYYNHGMIYPQDPMSHLLHLGAPVPTCAGSFILLCHNDVAGNQVVVLDHNREDC